MLSSLPSACESPRRRYGSADSGISLSFERKISSSLSRQNCGAYGGLARGYPLNFKVVWKTLGNHNHHPFFFARGGDDQPSYLLPFLMQGGDHIPWVHPASTSDNDNILGRSSGFLTWIDDGFNRLVRFDDGGGSPGLIRLASGLFVVMSGGWIWRPGIGGLQSAVLMSWMVLFLIAQEQTPKGMLVRSDGRLTTLGSVVGDDCGGCWSGGGAGWRWSLEDLESGPAGVFFFGPVFILGLEWLCLLGFAAHFCWT